MEKTTKHTHKRKGLGTAPVYFTAITSILGAILFLRLGYAVGTLGFWGAMAIIVVGHLITLPTSLAISELATNTRVEGGGVYFIISRSFGLKLGATVGIALFLSQAIALLFIPSPLPNRSVSCSTGGANGPAGSCPGRSSAYRPC